MRKQPPKQIEVIPEEQDRQNAGRYSNGRDCLMATALKRMGYKEVQCFSCHHAIDGFTYFSNQTGSDNLHYDQNAWKRPYYGPGVVGKPIMLTLN